MSYFKNTFKYFFICLLCGFARFHDKFHAKTAKFTNGTSRFIVENKNATLYANPYLAEFRLRLIEPIYLYRNSINHRWHYTLLVLFLMSAVSGYAKGYYTSRERPDQLMFHVTPTVSLLDYKSAEARSIISGNIGVGMEYAHFFSQYWGVSAGAEISSFSSFYFFKGRKDSLELFDNWSSRYYKLRQNLTTKEYQNVTYLSFPVKFMYRHIFTKRLNFNASIGAAYGLYLTENKSIISGTIDRQAFFGDIYVNIDDFKPLMFGKFTDYIHPSPVKQFKSTVLAIAQAGFSLKLAEDWNLHTELNLQYGFKNIKTRAIPILVPDEYSGVTATNYIGNIRPVSLGVRIGLAYTFDIFNVDCKCHNPLF